MNFMEVLKETANVAWRQISDYAEIVRLKLRIIGFSNKRSGLFTKLGELAYMDITENRDPAADEEVKRLIGEARAAGEEIAQAENLINDRKEKASRDRSDYSDRMKKARGDNPPPGSSGVHSFDTPAAPPATGGSTVHSFDMPAVAAPAGSSGVHSFKTPEGPAEAEKRDGEGE